MFIYFVAEILMGFITERSLRPICGIMQVNVAYAPVAHSKNGYCNIFHSTNSRTFTTHQMRSLSPWNWEWFYNCPDEQSQLFFFMTFYDLQGKVIKGGKPVFLSFSKCLSWEPSPHVVRKPGHLARPRAGVLAHIPTEVSTSSQHQSPASINHQPASTAQCAGKWCLQVMPALSIQELQ